MKLLGKRKKANKDLEFGFSQLNKFKTEVYPSPEPQLWEQKYDYFVVFWADWIGS